MQRSLFIHGSNRRGVRELAESLASSSGKPWLDLTDRAQPELSALLDPKREPSIVALHETALLSRLTRLSVLDQGILVSVLPGSGEAVPSSSEAAALEALRGPLLREAHAAVAAASKPEEATQRLLALWRRAPIAVAAGERSYCVDIGSQLIESLLPTAVAGATAVLLVTDENVEPLHGHRARQALDHAGIRHTAVVLPAGEEHKHLGTPQRIWQAALDMGLDRRGVLVALGGGVVTDISGFAAASWMRGIRWVGIPTTLLAMVDASVGGKTGVDFGAAKNAVGAFWQPSAVLCDADTLSTEPIRGFRGALAEVIKTGLLGDEEILRLMERHLSQVNGRDPALVADLVRRCVRVKARVVSLDERESGLRATLNLGHTVGHALEADGKFVRWTHGEAVSLGLVAALGVGELLGRTPSALLERTVNLLSAVGLPVELEADALERSLRLLGHDKKRDGSRVKFVLCPEAGRAEVVPLELAELSALVPRLRAR